MGFVVQGLNELTVSIAKATAEVKAQAPNKVLKSLQDISSTAKSIAPRDSGELVDSISEELTNVGMGTVTGESGPTARHGRFMEWGTYKDAPQAFMGPALDRHSADFEEQIAELGDI